MPWLEEGVCPPEMSLRNGDYHLRGVYNGVDEGLIDSLDGDTSLWDCMVMK